MIIPLVLLLVIPFWKRTPKIALLLLLTPSSIMLFAGIASWGGDQPALQLTGLPGHSTDNLNPETRCYRVSHGCMHYGGEYLTQGPHNLGLRGMVSVFGWPPKTYHGPFPTQDEAVSLLNSAGAKISPAAFIKGDLRFGTNRLHLNPRFIKQLARDSGLVFFDLDYGAASSSAQIALFKDQCWLVRLTELRPLNLGLADVDCVYLIDGKTGDAFARYALKGSIGRHPWALHGRWRQN